MSLIYWTLVFLTAGQRLWELSFSRANRKKLESDGYQLREGKVNYAFMVALHLAWFIGLIAEPLFYDSDYSGWLPKLSLIIFLFAQILRFWTLKTLGRHWNTMVMSPSGPEEQAFVSSGPYRFIRHPNYLVVILEILFLPLMSGAYFTAIAATFLNAVILYRRILLEERFLFSRPGYEDEMRRRARFVPGII